MKSKVSIERVPRQVVEKKLLMALRDSRQVAILADEKDLTTFIDALKESRDEKAQQMADDFMLLRKAAFPESPKAKRAKPTSRPERN